MSSVFPNPIKYFTFQNFQSKVIYFSWRNIWEWTILELVQLDCCNLVSSNSQSNSQSFYNIQFKSSTRKKLQQLAVLKFDLANVLLIFISRFNPQFATRNLNTKTCKLQFHWNLQLLTRYSLFRNLRFYIVYGKIFFLFDYFLSSRRLWAG